MAADPFPQPPFPDYELLDSGGGEKLERFGRVVLRRPDPQALWEPGREPSVWDAAHLSFVRESDRGGRWEVGGGAPKEARGAEPEWTVRFEDASFLVRPTPFKHVGLFPEQAANWAWLRANRSAFGVERPRLLNLFGYTGAASVAAALAGFEVTHVDASRTSVTWTVENARASGLGDGALRVLVEDALAYARREGRRGSRYQVVLLDPPHHGRGPKGEKWQFEDHVSPLLRAVREVLADRAACILSTYAIGFTPLSLRNLMRYLGEGRTEVGELALTPRAEGLVSLPAGFCARWSRGLGEA